MSRKPPEHLSLEDLREQELNLVPEELESDFSGLGAEQELDFELTYPRDYEPEVWEIENEEVPDDSWNDQALEGAV